MGWISASHLASGGKDIRNAVDVRVSTPDAQSMLTRLEADGFKNLLDFTVEFGPFTCLAGPNAVGKSNVFDAIRFLSLLTEHTIMDAALKVRGADPETTDLQELFWTDGQRRRDCFRLAAEMIVDENVEDDFGRRATATSTFLRYEVEIGYEPPDEDGRLARVRLLAERLDYITEKDAPRRLRFPHSASGFRRFAVKNRRRSNAGYISTEESDDGQAAILVHQDGGAGKPQKSPAAAAPKTVIGTSNTSATPTILAARREMQRWMILALEPTAMRGSDRFHTDAHITSRGDHLPSTLHRLSISSDHPERILSRIANRLAELVDVRGVAIERDDVRQLLTLTLTEEGGAVLPARALSDGTLRFLTLCVVDEDPEVRGLICMEEPENGIHPAKMEAMVELLRDLAIDVTVPPDVENPMRQIIIASHSPLLVQLMHPEDLLCAVATKVSGEQGQVATTLRCRPMVGTWRSTEQVQSVGLATLLAYLTRPSGAQIRLVDASPQFEPNAALG